MIAADGETAYMLDTPMSETATRQIVEWVREALGAKITGFIANHWHGDCIGGCTICILRGRFHTRPTKQ